MSFNALHDTDPKSLSTQLNICIQEGDHTRFANLWSTAQKGSILSENDRLILRTHCVNMLSTQQPDDIAQGVWMCVKTMNAEENFLPSHFTCNDVKPLPTGLLEDLITLCETRAHRRPVAIDNDITLDKILLPSDNLNIAILRARTAVALAQDVLKDGLFKPGNRAFVFSGRFAGTLTMLLLGVSLTDLEKLHDRGREPWERNMNRWIAQAFGLPDVTSQHSLFQLKRLALLPMEERINLLANSLHTPQKT